MAPLMPPTKFPDIPVSLERNTEVFLICAVELIIRGSLGWGEHD